ncbi:TRAP transporter substrate-binding protein [Kushneria indalinina]|uniref:Tripartite ATP-independent transporter DctP family solute receptor n=1 Tax=Kushneria indalinina DSM 14324 TaxID=1122140 RepID=A0A3D9DWA1_9GAMM|nr:TRAP transporter substrate-binding protein [Kushneria indalinina]REC95063.1 tripartite ATP-independent transporter DctP family solute receptor [Kushneria indalinina DSM 14324]
MKKIALLTTLLAGATLGTDALAQRTMNLAFTPPLDSHYGDAGRAFADRIDSLSDGEINIALKPSGALGGERDVIEGMQIGTVELAISSTGPIGNFVPEVYALDFPFLFKSYDSAHEVLDGEIGQDILDALQPAGLIGLAWAENGFRHVTNSTRSIENPEDFKGLKLRTMENEVHIAAFQALGAAPTPMSWTEVLTSLQQGTIDGQENPVPIITANSMWEMQDYATLTSHAYSPAAVVMSEIYWDQLSEKEKGWFREAAKAAAEASRETVANNEQAGIERMRKNGMTVVESIDQQAFERAVQPVYDQYAERYAPELIERIRAAQQ